MKKIFAILLSSALLTSLLICPVSAYTDVPSGSALSGEVEKAVDYGLMSGYSSSTFGYGDSMTRAQFVTVLDRMFGWSASSDARVAMWLIPKALEVPDTLSQTYLSAIEKAVEQDVIDDNQPFRPNDPITRGEMAEMLVRALGLKSAAVLSERQETIPFTDVNERAGYISVAYSIGMTKGTSATTFSPQQTATRAQAAAMLVRIYEKINQKTDFIHGFYAISSYSQLNLAGGMDTVSAGWSRMTWDGNTAFLKTTSSEGNEYAIPTGYEEVVETLDGNGTSLHLSVFMDGEELKDLLASQSGRAQAVEEIIKELTASYDTVGKNPYDGVTIDFEGLRSTQKDNFNAFLQLLASEVHDMGKSLYVCVPSVLTTGSYYDGYDYETILTLADKMILMAYDYETRDLSQFIGTQYYQTAATVPLDQVYWFLQTIAKEAEGLQCSDKLVLGISCKNVAWQIDENNNLLSGEPVYLSNDTVAKRLAQNDTVTGWSSTYQQSYAIYTADDGNRYFLWYQDARSVAQEVQTARLLGVTGLSFWRLGTIPQYTIGTINWSWSDFLRE